MPTDSQKYSVAIPPHPVLFVSSLKEARSLVPEIKAEGDKINRSQLFHSLSLPIRLELRANFYYHAEPF